MQKNSKYENDKTAVDWVLEGGRGVHWAALLVDLSVAVRDQVAALASVQDYPFFISSFLTCNNILVILGMPCLQLFSRNVKSL